jgi:hypothetical protein
MKYKSTDIVILRTLNTVHKTNSFKKSIITTLSELESLKKLCKENFFKRIDREKLVYDISDSFSKFYREKKGLVTKSD